MTQPPPESPYGNNPNQPGQPGQPNPYGNQPGQPDQYGNQPNQYGNQQYGGQPQPQKKGMAIAALVLGIIALLFSWTVIGGILFGVIAIILGIIAAGKAKKGTGGGRVMAIIGAVLGGLGLIISVGLIALGAAFFNSDTVQGYQDCLSEAGTDQAAIDQCNTEFEDQVNNQVN